MKHEELMFQVMQNEQKDVNEKRYIRKMFLYQLHFLAVHTSEPGPPKP